MERWIFALFAITVITAGLGIFMATRPTLPSAAAAPDPILTELRALRTDIAAMRGDLAAIRARLDRDQAQPETPK